MKIDLKQYDKLKTEDRLEYLLIKNHLNNRPRWFSKLGAEINGFLSILLWSLLAIPLYYIAFGIEVIIQLLPSLFLFFKIYIWVLMAMTIIYGILEIRQAKGQKEINDYLEKRFRSKIK